MAADAPKATAQDVIETLRSIDHSLKLLVGHFGIGARPTAAASADVATIAPNSDLDGQYGDEPIKAKDPRDWTGESMKGKRMSECPPEYLDLIAARCDYFASESDMKGEKDDKGRPKSFYDKRTASRARGWAARLRGGWTAPVADTGFPSDGAQVTDDDIPF